MLQFRDRISSYVANGHPLDKIEILVLGGTWSEYPEGYQVRQSRVPGAVRRKNCSLLSRRWCGDGRCILVNSALRLGYLFSGGNLPACLSSTEVRSISFASGVCRLSPFAFRIVFALDHITGGEYRRLSCAPDLSHDRKSALCPRPWRTGPSMSSDKEI